MRAMETAINERRPPSASAARLRSNIFYFLMKREEMKRKTHLLKKHRCGGGGRGGGNAELALATFTCTFLHCFILPERTLLCPHNKHFQNTSLQSVLPEPFKVEGCHCEVSVWGGGGCRGSPSLTTRRPLRDSGTNELTFLSNAHSCDMISGSERAGNERGRLIFLFPAN